MTRVLAAVAFVLFLPAAALADIVHLTNGRTLSVESWEIKGDVAVLVLRNGGLLEAPESAITEILPDEYIRPKPEPLAAASPVALPVVTSFSGIQALVAETATR